MALLITIGMVSASAPINLAGGAKTGAIYACLVWLGANLTLYGFLDLVTLTLVVVDSVLELVHGAIGGALIGIALSKLPKPATE